MAAGRNFHRVSKRERCPCCGKPDWCMLSNDGEAAICSRVQEGSIRTIEKAGNFVGYLHRLKDRPERVLPLPKKREHAPTVVDTKRDWPLIAGDCQDAIDGERLRLLAKSLGLSIESLHSLGIGWASRNMLASLQTSCHDDGCWTFPMKDHRGNIVGIRLRAREKKYAITGSDGNGIFDLRQDAKMLMIVEGPTSAAAMFDLGYSVIGRASCTGSTANCVEASDGKDVVIYGDSDKSDERGHRPGRDGAIALAKAMSRRAKSIKIMQAAGEKDVRAMKIAGADRGLFDILISQAVYFR